MKNEEERGEGEVGGGDVVVLERSSWTAAIVMPQTKVRAHICFFLM